LHHFSDLEEENLATRQGAVLVFLPGEREITEVRNYLEKNKKNKKWWILPLHSR
jgi:HrpA-like RNA helicase